MSDLKPETKLDKIYRDKTALEELDRVLTKQEVRIRPDSGQRYVDGEFITSQLNKIFGNTNWSNKIVELKLVQDTTGQTKTGKDVFKVGYLCQMTLIVPNLTTGQGTVEITEIGAGSGIDADLLKSHESASKEAVTDTLKRCAMRLGNALGLCLYDKDFKPQSEVDVEFLQSIGQEPAKNVKTIGLEVQKATNIVKDDVQFEVGEYQPEHTSKLIGAIETEKGASYNNKDVLKEMGFKFDKDRKLWVIFTDEKLKGIDGIIYKELK